MTKRWLAVLLTAVLLITALTACSLPFMQDEETEEPTTTTTEEPTTTTTAKVYPVCYVTATKLNVRREPNTDGELLGQLVYGAAVEILETTVDGWCRIDYNGTPAYISSAYISIQKPPSTTATTTTTAAPTPTTTFAANSTVYVTATKLNVRRKPAADGAIMGQLLYGTEVVVLETVDGWCRIEFEAETAYVSMDYVSLTPPPSTTAASTITTKAD